MVPLGTVYCQTISPNDSITISTPTFDILLKDARRYLILSKDVAKCDTALLSALREIENDSILLEIKDKQIASNQVEIKRLNRRVTRAKVGQWVFGGVGAIGIIYFAVKP